MSEPLFDPAAWREAPVEHGLAAVHARIPQRHEMGLLHGVIHYDEAAQLGIGVHHSTPDDFWVRGHIPGRPLMPAVVIIEICAQLSSWVGTRALDVPESQFFGFGGMEHARFRGQVRPGDTVLAGACLRRLRRTVGFFETQAYVDDRLVFEGQIVGVLI